jgi:hypothetical protein
MPECSICTSDHLEDIERAMAAGASLRDLEARFGTSRSALSRHQHHAGAEETTMPVAPAPETPTESTPSLCPLRDEADEAPRRAELTQAIEHAATAIEHARAHLMDAGARLVVIKTLRELGAFPTRMGSDLQGQLPAMPVYKAWLAEIRRDEEAAIQAITAHHTAIMRHHDAQEALHRHTASWTAYHAERAYLQTEQGQRMEREYIDLCQAREAALAAGHGHTARALGSQIDDLRWRFGRRGR